MNNSFLNTRWLKPLSDFFYPPLCLGCAEYTESENFICDLCFRRIEKYDNPICLNCFNPIASGLVCPVCKDLSFPLMAYGNYTSPLKDIIIQYKFHGITSPAKLFAQLIWDNFQNRLELCHSDTIIPIPLHPLREHYRGYNQAELLARELALLTGYKIDNVSLSRVKIKKPQARLSLGKRLENIKNVFELSDNPIRDRSVILVDDVVTSGSTVLEARRILSRAGINVEGVVAIAHSL